MKISAALLSLFLLFGLTINSSAHEGHNHKEPEQPVETQATNAEKLTYAKINEAYIQDVKPTFQRSCFDCHSRSPRVPWYHSVPLVHGLIESDMKEAKVHLDFSNDFPFKGHGSPKEDLEAIGKAVEKGTMPPFRYKAMHWRSGLSADEKKAVLKWTGQSLQLLDAAKEGF